MAAIAVTSANTNNLTNGARNVVRTSAGVPYVVCVDATDGGIEVWKANATTPASFSEQNAAGNPQTANYGSVSCAIDSSNIIHIAYMYYNTKTSQLRYVTFNTGTDTFSGDTAVNSDIGGDPTALSNLYTAIAIDANDIPHVAYSEYPSKGALPSLFYNNRIGGAWNASGLEVEGLTNVKVCINPAITIDLDNKPVIAYNNDTDDDVTVAIGNANDPSSWTLYDVDTDAEATGTQSGVSIAVDSSGNHYVAYRDESDTYIYINKHNYADAWTTWQTRQTNSKNGINPQLVINGTDIYIFYEEDSDNDIVYDKYSGTWGSGSWRGDSPALETGTFNTVKAKWAFWVDNYSGGVIRTQSQGTLVTQQTGGSNEFWMSGYSGRYTKSAQSFTGITGNLGYFKCNLKKVGSPTGTLNAYLYTHSGTYGTSSVPTGGTLVAANTPTLASSISTSNTEYTFTFKVPYPLVNGNYYCISIEYSGGATDGSGDYIAVFATTSGSHDGNFSRYISSWSAESSADMTFKVYLSSITYATVSEIDYVFVDETASPDVQWNTLSLVTSQIKKFIGVAQANLKKVIGVTNATMKKLEGVANQ